MVMATDAGPCHGPPAKSVVTDPNEVAAVLSSAASPSQAAPAASIGATPAPVCIRVEFTSGGNNPYNTQRLLKT
ncbi:hypothetical protein NJB18091_03940 [Mycobacterium marinum]|uniref:Uncharacterized protein n=1 Tax=Mycobacterium shottsii TaxID=133549 RepID=A0A7I7LCR0_9MYCO|nr:hypothetical protein MMRN_37620 [Mycobacterium marinum]BBX57568.1 hypothetical protein MSHO_29130 [Mycobacterium shottsii]GJN97199.1 hypothetical protein NJB1907E8_47100 [Mycobacterium marinum]GJO13158.1 hypothetical protein NJB1907f34b_48780 [Mycobacterium marinum]GJO16199.1 hypothetical protein NJB1907E90_43590 [Mycobacterium marinum]